MQQLAKSRESQSVQLRRTILKATTSQLALNMRRTEENEEGSVSLSSNLSDGCASIGLFDQLSDADKQYQARLVALQKFKAKSKVSTKQNSLKIYWEKEHHHLCSAIHNIECDIGSLLEIVLLHFPTDSLLQSLLEDSFINTRNRKEQEREFVNQIGEIKGLFKETSKAIKIKKLAIDSIPPPDEVHDEAIPAAAIFADVLMQLRTSHNECLKSMSNSETQLSKELSQTHRSIVAMLQQDRLQQQNLEFNTQIRLEEGDDAQVALLLEEWYSKLETIDRSHNAELHILKAERSQLDLAATPETASGGGLSESEEKIFSKVYSHARKTGMSRRALLGQLTAQLPDVTSQDIDLHEQCYKTRRALSQRKALLVSEYETSRANLLSQAKIDVNAFRIQRRASAEVERKQFEHENSRQTLHEVLSGLRAAKLESEAKRRIKKGREDTVQAKEVERLAAAKKTEFEWKKQQVEIYKQVRQQMCNHLAGEEARLKEEARIATLILIEANKEKVSARQRVLLAKEEEKRKRELQLLAEDAFKMDMLMRLAAQVPYYEDIQNATSKLDHITAAARAQQYQGGCDEFRGFMRPTGFADNKIISDARFRLAAALRDASPNLIQSNAAQNAIAQFHPRSHLAINGILSRTSSI